MNFIGGYQFGSLTTKSGQTIKLEDFDRDGNGKISQQEYLFIQRELGVDTLELSEGGKKQEKQVTDEEYVTWALEMQTDNILNDFIAKVATDFIGSNSVHSSKVIAELRKFAAEFKANFDITKDDVAELGDNFATALQTKYDAIKAEILGADKDYDKVQQEWEKQVEDFNKNIKNASSITEYVKINRDFLKAHSEYIQKMLASKDLDTEARKSLIDEGKSDVISAKQYSNLMADGINMQGATAEFTKKLQDNCPGWKELLEEPLIANPDKVMLEFYFDFRDNPNPLKLSMTTAYREMLDDKYTMLSNRYQNLVDSGQINPDVNIEYKPEENN